MPSESNNQKSKTGNWISDAARLRDVPRYRTATEANTDQMMEFLKKTLELAPRVQEDLFERAAQNGLAKGTKSQRPTKTALRRIASDWATEWNLCGTEGPCDWAVIIAVDTLKFKPDFGWNLGTYLSMEFSGAGMALPEKATSVLLPQQQDDCEYLITVAERQHSWKAWKQTPNDCIDAILALVKIELQDKLAEAAQTYRASRTPTRQFRSETALVWLIRYLFLEESFSNISRDTGKYLKKPIDRRGKPYSLPGVIRDTEEIAAQLGLQLQKVPGGRTKGSPNAPNSTRQIGAKKLRKKPLPI